jgi:Protein of unknown function (DUF1552)
MTTPVNRRTFLRAAGLSLALPLLESVSRGATPAAPPRRVLLACTGLGIHAPNLFPDEAGKGYRPTPYLEVLKGFRDQITVCSGLSHPEVDGGHSSEASYLTAAPHPGGASFRNTISLDQFIVEQLKPDTRFPYLALGTRTGSLSFARSGVQIPSDTRPSRVFARLFLNGTAREIEGQVRRLRDGESIMDAVRDQARQLQGKVNAPDRERLEQYFTAVREVEKRMVSGQEWARKPKPKVKVAPPRDVTDPSDTVGRTRLMFDLAHLAFQTDSTRVITLKVDGANLVPPIEGVTIDHHNLSHHGRDPEKLAQLRIVETRQMEALRDFLVNLVGSKEAGGSLLDRTMVFYGSNLGNASSHDTKNMPVLLAGGGFRHGQHLAFDRKNNTPLCNLYVSMLRRLGVEADAFASGKARLTGLDLA